MKKTILTTILLVYASLQGFTLQEDKFKKNDTLLSVLNRYNIPQYVYYDLSAQDKEIVSDISKDAQIYILPEDNNTVRQILIQANDVMQFAIDKNKNNKYTASLMPIAYEIQTKVLHTAIKSSTYNAIVDIDPSLKDLAEEFKAVFFNTINFKKDIRKGDRISIVYEEKLRLSKRVAPPRIKSASISIFGVEHSVFYFNNRYYNDKGYLVKKFHLITPLKSRVTSSFSLKRWHPVLKRYRAHHGIDYSARVGTKIKSAWGGRIVFAGKKGGYGKTIIIQHIGGYKTLYAHLSKFAPNIRKNKLVKQGEYIAKTGNTGLTSGPHLHFGLYKNSKPINPKSYIEQKYFALKGKKLQKFTVLLDKYKYKMLNASYGVAQDIIIALK